MSHLLDRLNFLRSNTLETFANGHGQVTNEDRGPGRRRTATPLAPRQGRALDPRGELHRLLHLGRSTSNPWAFVTWEKSSRT